MFYRIIIGEEAQTDIQKTFNYYEQQRPGLGGEILVALLKHYNDLAECPTHYSFIEGQPEKILRNVIVEGFPYVLIFEVSGEDVIVYALHNTQDHYRSRLQKA
jgi:toxin ParE1/3/4